MQVGIVLGTRSQWTTMKHTAELLVHLGIPCEARIITAKKSSRKLDEYASEAINRGLDIIIASYAGETYLPGIIAAKTEVPVVGIQINTSTRGKRSCNSNSDNKTGNTIRMFNNEAEGAINAALYVASMLASKYPRIQENLMAYRSQNEFAKALQ